MNEVVIIGGGMAGLGAAYRCRQENRPAVIFEKNEHPGGHAWSWGSRDGFVFDDGPHISFTKDTRIQQLLAESLEGEYLSFGTHVNNYWQGYWIKHPAQCNLYGLPPELVVDILHEFATQPATPFESIQNYEQWLVAKYGRTFAETFPMQYGKKYHTVDAGKMSIDWVGPRLYQPELKEVLLGALTPVTPDVHYVGSFRYPAHGGFKSFLKGLSERSDIRFGRELTCIEPRARRVRFNDEYSFEYDTLVSSVPLPRLLSLVEGAPADIAGHAQRLACTSCVTVNIGLNRRNLSDAHWTYIYDRDIETARVSFPHMFSPNNAPPETGSVQAELYFSEKYRPMTGEAADYIDVTIGDLRKCGIIREDDEILHTDARLIPYANVIFDLERAQAVDEVSGYLEDIGVFSCGRYGEWGYHWTDESFISGENAAQKVLDGR